VHLAPLSLSSLVASSLFLKPNYPLLAPKIPLFNGYFAPSSLDFNGSERFCLYHYSEFLYFSSRILQHFALHLAPKHLAFCSKTHSILYQNVLYFAPKRTLFCTKMHSVSQQIAQKRVRMAVFLNKNSFCRMHILTLFCIKTNLREN